MRWIFALAVGGMVAAVVVVGCGRGEKGSVRRDEASAASAGLAGAAASAPSGTGAAPVAAGNGRGTTAGGKPNHSSLVASAEAVSAARREVDDADGEELAAIHTVAALGTYLTNGGDAVLAAEKMRQFVAQGDAIVPELKALLTDPAPEVAFLGAEGLAAIGAPAALQELVAYLEALSPDDEQRRELASLLAEKARNAESVPYWNALLEKADLADDVRDAAVCALAHSLNASDLKELGTRYAATQDETMRQTWADVVRQVEGTEYVPQLIALAGDPAAAPASDPLVLAAWDTLATIGAPQGVTKLLAWMDQVDGDAAAALAHAISMVHNPESLAILQQAAASGSPRQRAAAARALGREPSR